MIRTIRAALESARRVLRLLAERANPELAREIDQLDRDLGKIDLHLLRGQRTRGR